MSGKRYPEVFKIEAVKQVVERGHSIASVATRLDITTQSLYAWVKSTALTPQPRKFTLMPSLRSADLTKN
ncbi:transposase [Pantoea sp. B9002]|uniref:transposase n=1 Tax=Pantoea sp. B9002 TaxID=2726979 RepID=UPI0021051ACB|nr:transposase [Pantoea sp. B9002]